MIECIDVNSRPFLRFIEEVLTENFLREYLKTYINICKENSDPLMGKFLITYEKDQVSGGVLGRIQMSYSNNNNDNNNNYDLIFYIETFAINRLYRRLGFSQILLREIEQMGQDKNLTSIELHVSLGNLVGLLFYYKNSFKLVSIHKHFYQNIKEFRGSKTGLLFSKRLPNIDSS